MLSSGGWTGIGDDDDDFITRTGLGGDLVQNFFLDIYIRIQVNRNSYKPAAWTGESDRVTNGDTEEKGFG